MKVLLNGITDRVSTKKGMWVALAIWLGLATILGGAAPGAKDYQSTVTGGGLPSTAKSVIANNQLENYFSKDEGIPALLVISEHNKVLDSAQVSSIIKVINEAGLDHFKSIVPFDQLPTATQEGFFSEDRSTVVLPTLLTAGLEAKEMNSTLEEMKKVASEQSQASFVRITGPAGIASDAVTLFSRADVTLILSTVGLIFLLLIVIYRSPLLVFIPLLASAIVYEVVDKTLGLMGKAGMDISNQSLSIMSILLFASVTDYSLFVFARYREELSNHANKYEAMKMAMRQTGEPVFFSGGTVFAAMLVLFVATFKDYRDFAPVFATTMAIIMLASITLVPALFQLFGRKSFWPKVPKLGDVTIKENSVWSKVGRIVSSKPRIVASTLLIVFVLLGFNTLNMNFQFDSISSFPKDMPSREGYEKLEQHFPKGDLAPTTIILKSDEIVSDEKVAEFILLVSKYDEVKKVSVSEITEDGRFAKFSLSFEDSPYVLKSLDALDELRGEEQEILSNLGMKGELFFAGETAKQADIRIVNKRDTWIIIVLESLLILALLCVLTRSLKSSMYMMGTILLSYASALGLGILLVDLFFGYDAISTRVPVYAFVFLVALGVDYNIMLMSRFKEERKKHSLKDAVQISVSRTGSVITSAGLILAATFAVLMTQPIAELFVFGFIVALGILMDAFIVRGILLPALIMLFEKDDKVPSPTNRLPI